MTNDDRPLPAGGLPTRLAASAKRARGTGGLVMILAVVLLALNLRPAVNALGVVGTELQQATGLSGTVTGVLFALPTLCFAVVGIIAPSIAARIGSHRAVLVALVALTGGQVLRAVVPEVWALFAGSILALAGIAIGNVLLPGLIRLHFPTAIGPMTAVYTTVLMLGQTLGAGITLPIAHGLGGSWRLGIGMWAVTAGLALAPWIVAVSRRTPRRAPGRDAAIRSHDAARGPQTEYESAASGGAHQDAALRDALAGADDAAYDGPRISPDSATLPEVAPQAAGSGPTMPPEQARAISVWALIHSPRSWAMAFFFGFQSLQAYVVFGWIPKVLIEAGMSAEQAGVILAILTAVGIPISAVVPALLGAVTRQWILVVAFVSALVLGYLGLLLAPLTATWLLALLIGFGLGSFPMGLALMAMRARTPAGTTALSGFGQSVGYVFASIGPIGFGFLHDLSGGSTVPLIALLISLLPLLIGGLVVAADWRVEDDIRPRRDPAVRSPTAP